MRRSPPSLPRSTPCPRRAFTLVELLVGVVVAATLGAIAMAAAVRALDGVRVRAAASELRAAFALARHLAVLRATRAAVRLDAAAAAVSVHVGADTALRRPLGSLHGVTLATTRDSMAYAPNGLGFGAANLSAVVRRGARAETVVVSRLGRVR